MNIFTETKGKGDNIVLLHGACDNHHYMQPIMDQLCDRYQVTSLDEPGRGLSKWQPQIKNIHDLADALLPVLPEKAIYINWSFGGLIAISIAARYPDRVKRIINIGSVPKFIENTDWPGVPQPGFKALLPIIAEHGLPAFLKRFHDSEFANFNPKPKAYHVLNRLLENMEVDIDAINKRIHICDATDLRQEFRSLKCPIDLILGEKDEAVPTALHEKIKALNPKVNIHIIPGAQHMLVWTHPMEFNKILEKILATHV
jgi:pimeloyl-[acyl-carrier protein] methyl ester esterase